MKNAIFKGKLLDRKIENYLLGIGRKLILKSLPKIVSLGPYFIKNRSEMAKKEKNKAKKRTK